MRAKIPPSPPSPVSGRVNRACDYNFIIMHRVKNKSTKTATEVIH